MRTFRWLAASFAVLLAAGTLALAQEEGGDSPSTRWKRGEHRARANDDGQQRPRGPQGDQGARGKGGMARGDGFLFMYMRNNERYEKAFADYTTSQQAILEAMKQLHETMVEKLKAATTNEEREQIIADSKVRTKEQLTKLVAGMIEHRKTITTMLEEDEAAIVDSAIAKIYERRRPPQDGDQADGRGPGSRRGPRGNMGGDDMPPPPPPGE